MPSIQAEFGEIGFFEDFIGFGATASIADATAGTRLNDICLVAISGQTEIDWAVDEPNGVVTFTGAGGAADGIALLGAPMRPDRNGTMVMGARFKSSVITDYRVFCGWQQTCSLTETVNPFTLSGTTLTANNGGEVAGIYFDAQATTDDFRVMSSTAGVADTAAQVVVGDHVRSLNSGATTLGSLGIRSGITATAAKYTALRVEMDPDGVVRCFAGDETVAATRGLKLIATIKAGALSTSTLYFPHLHLACHSTGDPLFSIDYFFAKGRRYWAA